MPYVRVLGLPTGHDDQYAKIYGLNSEERTALMNKVEKTFKPLSKMLDGRATGVFKNTVTVRALEHENEVSLIVVNLLHELFGYEMVSYSVSMSEPDVYNNQEVSYIMYKK